jgi:hypothetical protein
MIEKGEGILSTGRITACYFDGFFFALTGSCVYTSKRYFMY